MAKLEFDDEFSRLMETFNVSPEACERRRRIAAALDLRPGLQVLDVGCGPGHQIAEMAPSVAPGGEVHGIDTDEIGLGIACRRCEGLGNVSFHAGDASALPFDDGSLDRVMSSQVFEYLDDIAAPLAEMHRVLKPGGRVLVHGTAWPALMWYSADSERMTRVLKAWDGHLADPRMCETFLPRLRAAGFSDLHAEPIVHVETEWNPDSMSGVLTQFVSGYVASQGLEQSEINAWLAEFSQLSAEGAYFFSSSEYMFLAWKA